MLTLHVLTFDHYLATEQGLTCTVYTARIPGRKAKVIAKVARPRNNGRLEDQAERQLEAEFNVLRQVRKEAKRKRGQKSREEL